MCQRILLRGLWHLCRLWKKATWDGYLEIVKYLVSCEGIDLDVINDYHWTALMNATKEGHVDIATCLIDHGANVEIEDEIGWNALEYAKDEECLEIVKYLKSKN